MNCVKLHETLLGQAPSPELLRLSKHPNMRGFYDDGTNPAKFLAVFLLGLSQTLPLDGETFQRTVLLLPPNHEAWVVAHIKALARHMLAQHAGHLLYNVICKQLQALDIATRVLQIPEPARWVAFGFGPATPMPDWLRLRLLA